MKERVFHCLGLECPNHCCGDFNGFSGRLTSLSGIDFTEIILTEKDKLRLEKASLNNLIVDNATGIFTIKTSEKGTCAALQDGRCTIYEFRPAICRAFPLYLDFYVGLCVDKMCPAFDGQRNDDYKEALENLIEVYSFWINYYSKMI